MLSSQSPAETFPREGCEVLLDPELAEKGLTTIYLDRRWPKGIVPYNMEFAPTGTEFAVAGNVKQAIKTVNRETNLCFVPVDQDSKHLSIFFSERSTNYASLGYRLHSPAIMGMRSESVGVALHELLHVANMSHEHQRPDRDDHIIVHFDNIDPSNYDTGFLALRKARTPDSLLFYPEPYDVRSILHYGAFTFNISGKPTITLLDGSTEVGGLGELSEGDIRHVNIMYPKQSFDCDSLVASRSIFFDLESTQIERLVTAFCPYETIELSVAEPFGQTGVNYSWNTPGAEEESGSGHTFRARYYEPGRYKVFLTAARGKWTETRSYNVLVRPTQEDFRIMGNPVRPGENIRVQIGSNTPDFTLSLTTLDGRRVFDQKIVDQPCRTEVSLATPRLAPGMYVLTLDRGEVRENRKIIVNP